MTRRLTAPLTRGILLDIEGTTTPISFVHDVLFSHARSRMRDWLGRHIGSDALRAELDNLRTDHEDDRRAGLDPPSWSGGANFADVDAVTSYLLWQMKQDRKSTALKSIQGKIWEEAYRGGELRGQVFDDVPEALERWWSKGLDVRIFSSGSVLAQRFLFLTTEAGDLTRYLRGYFDTTTGPKADPRSYRTIAGTIGLPPSSLVFVSDTPAELDAARSAAFQTLLCRRPGNPPVPPNHGHSTIQSFEGLLP